jgi:hypothetical protein
VTFADAGPADVSNACCSATSVQRWGVASHVLGWIAGVCLATFIGIGLWMAMPVMWTSFRAPTEGERSDFTARRERIPFGPWFGLGVIEAAAAVLAVTLRY